MKSSCADAAATAVVDVVVIDDVIVVVDVVVVVADADIAEVHNVAVAVVVTSNRKRAS